MVSLAVLVLGALAWYLGSPLLLNRTKEEQLSFEVPRQAEMEAMPEQELAIVKSGEIAGADQFHQGSGTATIFELPDGSQILRLEDFMVATGLDLHVLLAAGARSPRRGSIRKKESQTSQQDAH